MNIIEPSSSLSAADRARLPNLLGIGAPKAATTWLAGVLAAHSDVFMPAQKELNAFHYHDCYGHLRAYLNHFAEWRGEPIRCDFSVRYLASPRAMIRAKNLVPDAKLLVCLRNPVDQVQSHYWHLRRQNFHQAYPVRPMPGIFEALEQFSELLREPALYGKHIARWLDYFPRDQLFIVRQEDLRREPQAELDRLCQFLGIAPDRGLLARAAANADSRGGVQPRSAAVEAFYAPLYAAFSRGPYMWLKRAFGVRAGEMLKRKLRMRAMLETIFFKPGYPALDTQGRQRLRSYFWEDIRLLEKVVGMPFADWLTDRADGS